VTNGIPLGSSLLLPVCTVNCVQTLKVPVSDQHEVVCRDDDSGLFFRGQIVARHKSPEDFDLLSDDEVASSDAAADAVAYCDDPYVHSDLYSVVLQDGSRVVQGADHCFSKEAEKTGFMEGELGEGDGVIGLYYDATKAGRASPDPDAAGAHTLYGGGGDARCAFSAGIYARGCHWIPRMFA
jgi:hypothetical protein